MSEPIEQPEITSLCARGARRDHHDRVLELMQIPGASWEMDSPSATPRVLFEHDGALVAVDAGVRQMAVALPSPATDPPPTLGQFPAPGETVASIGEGLWIAPSLSDDLAARIHRHSRTLRAMQEGTKIVLAPVPLPPHDRLEPTATAQMCVHGGLDWPAIRVPLEDGWWPLGLTPAEDGLVLMWRNRG